MKAVTLYQPWASLIAVGAKTIETRPRGTDYRGPLAIHAGKKRPDHAAMKRLIADEPDVWNLWYSAGRFGRLCTVPALVASDGSCDDVPLGAVVASATLVDVVPITGPGDERPVYRPCVDQDEAGLALWDGKSPLPIDIEHERPFGDFTPGRFAWLLADVKPTTERCPWCWGRGYRPDHADVHPEVRDDPNLPCGADACACPVCSGAGSCEPITARGQQATPWGWDPGAEALPSER